MLDIGIGLIILAGIALVAWLVTRHHTPTTPSGADLANTLSAAASDSWEALKRDLPSIVSAELAQAKAALYAAQQEAAGWKAKLEAAIDAHDAALAAVAARVSAAVTASPELPPSPVTPAVAAAQAEDVAAVHQLATELSPTP